MLFRSYPIVYIKLNSSTLDSIVIPKQMNILPINNTNYQWRIINGATITGAVWANVASDSTVVYNTNTTATMSGGDILDQGFLTSTVQAGGNMVLNTENIFEYQLERNSFTTTATTLTLAVATGAGTSNVAGAMSWEEIT